jgi:DNA-binding NarL/FixJ family response regulator
MRIVVVDDHRLMRGFLCDFCAIEAGDEVVGEADSGKSAVSEIMRTKPGAVLLDINLPDFGGFRVLEILQEAKCCPRCVLLISAHCSDLMVSLVEHAHVQGFLDKLETGSAVLGAALKSVKEGHSYWSNKFLEMRALRRLDPNAFDKILSDREITVLCMLGALLSDIEIGARLNISWETVAKHRFNIFNKLGLHSKLDLMRYARDHGFSDSPMVSYPSPACAPTRATMQN